MPRQLSTSQCQFVCSDCCQVKVLERKLAYVPVSMKKAPVNLHNRELLCRRNDSQVSPSRSLDSSNSWLSSCIKRRCYRTQSPQLS